MSHLNKVHTIGGMVIGLVWVDCLSVLDVTTYRGYSNRLSIVL